MEWVFAIVASLIAMRLLYIFGELRHVRLKMPNFLEMMADVFPYPDNVRVHFYGQQIALGFINFLEFTDENIEIVYSSTALFFDRRDVVTLEQFDIFLARQMPFRLYFRQGRLEKIGTMKLFMQCSYKLSGVDENHLKRSVRTLIK